jgi:anti-anti-sigma factor
MKGVEMASEHVLHLSGELDIAVIEPVRATWYAIAEQAKPDVIVLDLEAVTFLDSFALGAFVGLRRRQLEHGGDVVVVNASPSIATVFALTGLHEVFGVGAGRPGA